MKVSISLRYECFGQTVLGTEMELLVRTHHNAWGPVIAEMQILEALFLQCIVNQNECQ